jgi:hypothetical protein
MLQVDVGVDGGPVSLGKFFVFSEFTFEVSKSPLGGKEVVWDNGIIRFPEQTHLVPFASVSGSAVQDLPLSLLFRTNWFCDVWLRPECVGFDELMRSQSLSAVLQ